MTAYSNVGRAVGASAEWMRKYVKGTEAKEPGLTLGFKIILSYRRVCECVERAGDNERQLREQIDAALESIGLLVGSAEAEDRSGETLAGALHVKSEGEL